MREDRERNKPGLNETIIKECEGETEISQGRMK